jgi:hypothetical protein
MIDRTYSYTYKGNIVPFGAGIHASPEEALEAAKVSTVVPEDKKIIIKEIR